MSSRIILLFAFLISQVLLTVGCRDSEQIEEPIEFIPSGMSDSWVTLTCNEVGFEIKYPPDVQCTQSGGGDMVRFSGKSGDVNVRRYDEVTRKQIQTLWPDNPFSAKGKTVRVGDLKARLVVVGNGGVNYVFIERDSFTYEIEWLGGSESLGEEMAATFKFVDVKHSDYLTYTDADFGFVFDYPYAWNLRFGRPDGIVDLSDRSALRIDIEFKMDTTAEDFIRLFKHNITEVEEAKEHFLHHLVGRRCRWSGRETYLLENQNGTCRVTIDEARTLGSTPRKIIDDFLDSLRL